MTRIQADVHDAMTATVVAMLEDVIRDFELPFADSIDLGTSLVHDLGLSSTDFVMLTADIEDRFGCGLAFQEEALIPDGKPVEDIRVADVVAFLVERRSR
jgi:acyl carrier protein